MAIKVRSLDGLARLINVYEGIKLALLRQGRIRRTYQSEVAEAIEKNDDNDKSDKPDPKAEPSSSINSKSEDKALSETKPKKDTKVNEARKLETVAEKAHEILLKQDTVFPFTLFPDTVTVEREKVNIAKRHFFRVANIVHIPVRDLLHVDADVGPFFGSVHITSRFFTDKPFVINYLWREEALKLQRILQGYIIAHEREIDCTSIEKNKLIDLLNDLGGGDTQ